MLIHSTISEQIVKRVKDKLWFEDEIILKLKIEEWKNNDFCNKKSDDIETKYTSTDA